MLEQKNFISIFVLVIKKEKTIDNGCIYNYLPIDPIHFPLSRHHLNTNDWFRQKQF